MTTESLIADTMLALRGDGVPMATLGDIEARLLTLLYRARRLRNAESMLPLLGAQITAERLGCCKQTVYNLAKRRRKEVQENPLSLTGT